MAYKHDYDKILTRLTLILSKLNRGESLSVKELAKEFNVSERTIQRDFNQRLISFPIFQESKKWKMQKGFCIEKSTVIEETIVLDIMQKIVESSGNKFASKALPLLSKIRNESQNPIYAKLNMEDIGDKIQEVQQLKLAIKNRVEIVCEYQFEHYKKELKLRALKIANYEGFWYLIALDSRNNQLKKYYLKNISKIKILEEKFELTTELTQILENSISIWFDPQKSPFEVRLLIDHQIKKYLARKPLSKTQKIVSTYEDGNQEISLMITHPMEIIPIIKYWIPYIEVISPSFLREIILEDLEKYQKKLL